MASVARTWSNSSSELYYKNDIVVTSPNNGAYYICQLCRTCHPEVF